MFEFKGLIASAAKNENAGFVTPLNKNALSRKALFTDKSKVAFGDLKKNSFNVMTPTTNGTVEKVKQRQELFLPTTPHVLQPSTFASSEPNDSTPQADRIAMHTVDEMDLWHRKQMLSQHQFDFIFIHSPATVPPSQSPLSSPSPPPPFSPPPMPDSTESFWDFEHKTADDDYDLPSINNSLIFDDDE